MDSFGLLVLLYLCSIIPVAYAADKRQVGIGITALISLLFTPFIGFLFILCHPTKDEVEYHQRMLRMINDQCYKENNGDGKS